MEIDGKSIRESKARDPWSCYGSYLGGGDALSNSLVRGFSWPPRSYTCSFCKREFRSAQALGGHMNVHRRDRARLRQSPVSPPWDSPVSNPRTDLNFSPKCSTKPNPSRNHIPNLNVAPSSCAISSTFSSVAYTFPSLLTPINCTHFSSLSSSSSSVEAFCSRGDSSKTRSAVKALVGNGSFIGFSENSMSNISIKKAEVVRLELDVGMHGELKEDLDLELRLGYT